MTLFPEIFDGFLKTSIIGKAIEKKIIDINIFNIRKNQKVLMIMFMVVGLEC